MSGIKISPSIASADQSDLRRAIEIAERGGADFMHLDIEDGVFIPNLTFGPKTVRDLRPWTHTPFDVHLQVADPGAYLMDVVKAGANRICFQLEASDAPNHLLGEIKANHIQAGLALLAGTPLDLFEAAIDRIDFVHLMTNDPASGSDELIPEIVDKIRRARTLIGDRPIEIEVDGGINIENAAIVVAAGARVLVAGRAIWDPPAPAEAIEKLRAAAQQAL
jgi:ribulose-phosphate 3-epimerase